MKKVHVKPAFYSYCYYNLKQIASEYGYNLVLHGSLNRDLDLVAVPWFKEIKSHDAMIRQFADYLGGYIDENCTKPSWHGMLYVINMNRNNIKTHSGETIDLQYYLDISVILTPHCIAAYETGNN